MLYSSFLYFLSLETLTQHAEWTHNSQCNIMEDLTTKLDPSGKSRAEIYPRTDPETLIRLTGSRINFPGRSVVM